MPKQRLKSEVNSFVGGLNSDKSPLNYEPSFTKFEKNFEVNIDGTRDRRFGLDIDSSALYNRNVENLYSYGGVSQITWKTEENYTFFVFYSQNLLEIVSSTYPYSVLANLSLTGATASSVAVVDGKLIVAGNKVFVIKYASATNAFTTAEIRLKTRDIWGVEDGYENDVLNRPTSITGLHRYNLQNQSWGIPRKNSAGTLSDPITLYGTDLSKFPSNSETVWSGLQFQPVSGGAAPYERIYTNMYEDLFGSSISSAKGYFIIDLLTRGVSRAAAKAANDAKHPSLTSYSVTFPQDETTSGPTVVGSFAGRAWFAGFSETTISGDKRSPYLADTIFFTRLIKDETDFDKCYTEGDPTSRENNDIVDTDGGFIKITGMVKPKAMYELQKGLIVFASNGVWAIRGEDNTGFKATAYRSEKISKIGAISPQSVVVVEDKILFLSSSGVQAVELDNNGDFIVNEISTGRIRNYYSEIRDYSVGVYKRDPLTHAKGFYDPLTQKVRWTIPIRKNKNQLAETIEIVFDIRLKCYTINVYDRAFISCGFYSEANKLSTFNKDARYITAVSSLYHVLWMFGSNMFWGIARPKNVLFKDLGIDGIYRDAEAVMVTGDQVFSDSGVKKQAPFITVHMKRTETGVDEFGVMLSQSSCKMRTFWDWAYSEDSNKISSAFEVYRVRKFNFPETIPSSYTPEFDVATSRNKVLGIGRSLAIEFKSSPEKDCRILGWNHSITGNQYE